MPALARDGYTDEEIMRALRAALVKIDYRVELRNLAGDVVKHITNFVDGKVNYEASRPVQRTNQLRLQEPAGVGVHFDAPQSFNHFLVFADQPSTYSLDPDLQLMVATGGTQSHVVHHSFLHDDVLVECDVDQAPDGGLVLRFRDLRNHYMLAITDSLAASNANRLRIFKRIAGVYTELASAPISFVRGIRQRIGFEAVTTAAGTTRLRGFFNQLQVVEAYDYSLPQAGRVGYRSNGAGSVNRVAMFRARPAETIDYLSSRVKIFQQILMPQLLARTEQSAAAFQLGVLSGVRAVNAAMPYFEITPTKEETFEGQPTGNAPAGYTVAPGSGAATWSTQAAAPTGSKALRAVMTASGEQSLLVNGLSLANATIRMKVVHGQTNANEQPALVLRYLNEANHISVRLTDAGQLLIFGPGVALFTPFAAVKGTVYTLEVTASGASITATIYAGGVQKLTVTTNTTLLGAGQWGFRAVGAAGGTVWFDDLEILGATTGTRVSPALALSSIGVVLAASHSISWLADIPAGTSLTVETSVDGGLTWHRSINGGPISAFKLNKNYSANSLLVRATLTTASTAVRPKVYSITVRALSATASGQWVEIPVGLFIPTTPDVSTDDGLVVEYDLEGYDNNYVLTNSVIDDRLTFLAGTKITDNITAVLEAAGITDYFVAESATTLTLSKDWEPGTSRWDILHDLCEAGVLDHHVDENGRVIVQPWSAPTRRAINWVYKTDSYSLVRPLGSKFFDSFDVPNRVVSIVSEAARTTVLKATAENVNPDSPVSFQNRGFWKTYFDKDADAPDLATLQLRANKLLYDKSQPIEAVALNTIANGAHGHRDIIHLVNDALGLDAVYEEQAWELSLKMDAAMIHDIQRVVPL